MRGGDKVVDLKIQLNSNVAGYNENAEEMKRILAEIKPELAKLDTGLYLPGELKTKQTAIRKPLDGYIKTGRTLTKENNQIAKQLLKLLLNANSWGWDGKFKLYMVDIDDDDDGIVSYDDITQFLKMRESRRAKIGAEKVVPKETFTERVKHALQTNKSDINPTQQLANPPLAAVGELRIVRDKDTRTAVGFLLVIANEAVGSISPKLADKSIYIPSDGIEVNNSREDEYKIILKVPQTTSIFASAPLDGLDTSSTERSRTRAISDGRLDELYRNYGVFNISNLQIMHGAEDTEFVITFCCGVSNSYFATEYVYNVLTGQKDKVKTLRAEATKNWDAHVETGKKYYTGRDAVEIVKPPPVKPASSTPVEKSKSKLEVILLRRDEIDKQIKLLEAMLSNEIAPSPAITLRAWQEITTLKTKAEELEGSLRETSLKDYVTPVTPVTQKSTHQKSTHQKSTHFDA